MRPCGGVAQSVRACGSYPQCPGFKSLHRHQSFGVLQYDHSPSPPGRDFVKTFVIAIGLVFLIEGLPYFLCPERMVRYLAQIQELPPRILRAMGLVAMLFGLFLCYLAQRTDLFSL